MSGWPRPASSRCSPASPGGVAASPRRSWRAPARCSRASASPAGRLRFGSATRSSPRSRAATSSSPASSPACRRPDRTASGSASRSMPSRGATRPASCRRASPSAGTAASTRTRPCRSRSASSRRDSAGASRVRLRRPHGNLNPHGFDYELQLFEQGVRATGYVRDAPPPQLLGEAAGFPVERLRQRVRDAIYAAVPERRAAGVLAALAVGDQGAIEREDWERFRNTGVAHLMSISGLHITMFAWLAGLGSGRRLAAQPPGDAGLAGAERGALGRPRRGDRLRRLLRLGRAGAADDLDARRGLPAARRRAALAVAAGAARGSDARHPARSLGTDAARLLAVVRGGRPADGIDDGAAAGRGAGRRCGARRDAAGSVARSPRPAPACAPRWWRRSA